MNKKAFITLVTIFAASFLASITWSKIQARTEFILKITKEDPLFYSPEIDSAELKRYVSKLTSVENHYKEDLKQHIKKYIVENKNAIQPEKDFAVLKKIYESKFLPDLYLSNLAYAIDRTNKFFEKPSSLNAFEMLYADYLAARAYKKDSAIIFDLADQAVQARGAAPPLSFEGLGSKSDSSVALNDLRLIRKNGEELVRESRARLECFIFGRCNFTEKAYTKIAFAGGSLPALKNSDLLPDEILNIHASNQLKRSGPFLVQSGCFPKKEVWMYAFRDVDGFYVKQADQSYYFDLNALIKRSKDNPYIKFLSKAGISYDDQPEGTTYRCPDLSYWGDLATLSYFDEKLKEKDVRSNTKLDELLDYFRNNPDLPDAAKNILILENRIVYLPLMLDTLSRELELSRLLIPYQIGFSPLYLIAVRSAYSLTFNTFSKSVWRLDQRPQYFSEKNIPLPPIYKTYSDLKKIYSDEEIKKFHRPDRNYIL